MITVDLVTFLRNHPALTALVGERIYPISLPQEPMLPAMTYFRVDTPEESSHDGPSFARPRYQFDFYASTYLGCEAVAAAFKEALKGWRQGWRDPAVTDGPRDIPEPPELKRFRKECDVQFWEAT